MIYAMKEFVPEYKSQHSEYEAIDKEIAHADKSNVPVDSVNPGQPTAE